MKYIVFSANGELSARYDSDITPIVPEGAVEVSDDVFVQTMNERDGIWKIDSAGLIYKAALPPLSPEQLGEEALFRRDRLLQEAAVRIAPLQDAVDLDDATAGETALLKQWKQYRVALNRIGEQSRFPSEIDWPVVPE